MGRRGPRPARRSSSSSGASAYHCRSMDPDAYVLHQVHPAKLGADVAASLFSTALLWRGRPRPALLVRYGVPAIASIAVIRWADLAVLRTTRRGRYVLAHMPPWAIAARLAGDTVMAIGAARRSRRLVLLGGLAILAGWSDGAIVRVGL